MSQKKKVPENDDELDEALDELVDDFEDEEDFDDDCEDFPPEELDITDDDDEE